MSKTTRLNRVEHSPEQLDKNAIEKALNEAYVSQFSNVRGVQTYNFVRSIQTVDFYGLADYNVYQRMMNDSTISSAVDLYTEDSLQVDPEKGRMCWVEVDNSDSDESDNLSAGLQRELNDFLHKSLRIEKYLPAITKRVVVYGDSPVRLDYITKLEDDRTILAKESEESKELWGKILNESESFINNGTEYSNKDFHYDKYVDDSNIKTEENIKESLENKKSDRETLNESESLNEDVLKVNILGLRGRWYLDLLGDGTNLYAIEIKGKIVGYIDTTEYDRVIKGDRIIPFIHNTGWSQKVLQAGTQDQEPDERLYFSIKKGESLLKNARTAFQVLSALEDILIMSRLTRSILYRIFSVEVDNYTEKETDYVLNELKRRIKMDETIDLKKQVYDSELTGLPLGDSIFIPVRNGVGSIKIDTVGGDVEFRNAIDLDYFKDKLFAGLKIPKAFLGFETDLPGGLGSTSLVRMDIRYARTVKSLQHTISEGIHDICEMYLKLTRSESVVSKLPGFRVMMTSINTSEDMERVESNAKRLETVDKVVETLGNLGIDLNKYPSVREKVISDYFGKELVDLINKDEENGATPEETDVTSTPVESSDQSAPDEGGDLPPESGTQGLSVEPEPTVDVGTEEV